MTICAAGVIMNVTNKAENKLAFCQAKGIQALVEAVKRLSKQPQLVEPAVIGLRHVTNNHAKQDVAQSVLINEVNGLPHLMTALDHQMQAWFTYDLPLKTSINKGILRSSLPHRTIRPLRQSSACCAIYR